MKSGVVRGCAVCGVKGGCGLAGCVVWVLTNTIRVRFRVRVTKFRVDVSMASSSG